MKIYTMGFTGLSAEEFFARLKSSNVRKLIDIRLNNKSQLAGFTKGKDLRYFLKTIANIEYEHRMEFAPTKELLSGYRKKIIDWSAYEQTYLKLLDDRNVLQNLDISSFDGACLLCSEAEPNQCHRRLLAEYLRKNKSDIEVIHL